MNKILEKAFGKSPGLDVVVIVVTTFMLPLVLRKETTNTRDLLAVPTVWVGALMLSRVSARWDDWLFDPLYGSAMARNRKQSALARFSRRLVFLVTFLVDRCHIRAVLETQRNAAEQTFAYPDIQRRRDGIYETARTVFHGTEQWEKQIKPFFEFSKAARVFVWPIVIAFGWVVMHKLTGAPPYILLHSQGQLSAGLVGLSQSLLIIYLLLQAVSFLYLYLRLIHVARLYGLVSDATVFPFELSQKGNSDQIERMFRVGTIVMPVDELRIFKRRILCVGKIDSNYTNVLKNLDVSCLELKAKESATKNDIAKLLRADKADLYAVDSSLLADSTPDRLRELSPRRQVTVYPDIDGDVLIVPDTEMKDVDVAQLQKFLMNL